MLKEIKYTPKNLGDKFEGFVTINPPLLRDRLRYVKECNFQLDQNGSVNASSENIEVIAKMIEVASKHVIKVSLKKGAYTYESFEDLEIDTDAQQIVMEIASQVMNGFSLGES